MQIIAKKGVKLFRDFYVDMDVKPHFIPQNINTDMVFLLDFSFLF